MTHNFKIQVLAPVLADFFAGAQPTLATSGEHLEAAA